MRRKVGVYWPARQNKTPLVIMNILNPDHWLSGDVIIILHNVQGINFQHSNQSIHLFHAEYQQSPSTGAGEWVLTDLADSSQLGTSQRVREKMVKMSQATHTSTATPVAATRGERMEEKDRRIQEAEMRAQAAEERAREAERAKVTAERARVTAETCQQEEQTRRQKAELRQQVCIKTPRVKCYEIINTVLFLTGSRDQTTGRTN